MKKIEHKMSTLIRYSTVLLSATGKDPTVKYKTEINRSDPHARPNIIKVIRKNIITLSKKQTWNFLKKELISTGDFSDQHQTPLNRKKNNFGRTVFLEQVIPAAKEIAAKINNSIESYKPPPVSLAEPLQVAC